MIRQAQVVYILFFSVMFGAVLRVAGPWKAFPTYFFLLDDPEERRACGRRLALALLILNFCPFTYFAITVYLLGRIHAGGGWLMLLDFFCVPWIALAVPGFFNIFQGLSLWGGRKVYGNDFDRVRTQLAGHHRPLAFILPGLLYVLMGFSVLSVLLLI